VDAQRSSTINSLAVRSLQGTNRKDGGTIILDNLHFFAQGI
jgi:hypothetical protein